LGDPRWLANGGVEPQGFGIGGVAGTGVKFKFNDQFSFDVGYNAIFTDIKLEHSSQTDPFSDRGIQHVLYARIIWG